MNVPPMIHTASTKPQARRPGSPGTPGFFIGKTNPAGTIEATFIKGAQPITAFRQVIDGLLDGLKP